MVGMHGGDSCVNDRKYLLEELLYDCSFISIDYVGSDLEGEYYDAEPILSCSFPLLTPSQCTHLP